MASIQLRDGSTAEIPDGLSRDAMLNYATRAQAAYDARTSSSASQPPEPSLWDKVVAWGNQTPAEALGFGKPDSNAPATVTGAAPSFGVPGLSSDPTAGLISPDPIFTRERFPGAYAALDWLRSTQAGNFAGNVGADIAGAAWDAPASISNALLHTAQNYGYAPNEPSMPMAAPAIKANLGVTPITDPWGQRAETAAQIAATGGGNLISRLASGIFGEAKGEVGSWLGGKIADWTNNPQLHEALQTGGAVAAQTAPYDKVTAPITSSRLFANPEVKAKYDAAQTVQGVTGADQPPVTAGQLGQPWIQGLEKWLGKLPFTSGPIESAQSEVPAQIDKTIQAAAQKVAGGAPINPSEANAPGSALLSGVREQVSTALNTAKPQINDIENQLGTRNTSGPGGGSAMVDPRGLISELNGLKTETDAAGNVRAAVAPEIASQIDAEIANINRARQPEDPALDLRLQSAINTFRQGLADPRLQANPTLKAQAEAQLQQALAAQDANMKVPFAVVRQMKTLQGDETFGDGTPTLNGRMGGKIYDAYGNALQGFANQLDPALGRQYSNAMGAYNEAMNLRRTFKNVVDSANEQGLTSTLKGGLTAPEKVADYTGSPAWNQAAASTIAMLGRKTPGGPFNVNDFAQTWKSMPDSAKALYTRGSPDMIKVLDAAATLGSGFDPTGGRTKPVTGQEAFFALMADRLLNRTGGVAGAALAGIPYASSAGLESGAVKRALAGRSAPWSFQQNLPAIMAVAQQQGRDQGY